MVYHKNRVTSGVIDFEGLTINADPTKFDVGAGSGYFVDYTTDPENPNIRHYTWVAQTGNTSTYLTTDVGTFIGISNTGVIIQQVEDFDRDQLNTILRLGRLSHFGLTTITATYNFPLTIETDLDFAAETIKKGTVKLSGLEIEANSTDLSLKRLVGKSLRIGAGNTRENINFPESPESSGFSFYKTYRDIAPRLNKAKLVPGGTTTQIDTTHYDDGSGTLADVTDGNYTNLYVYFFPYKDTQTIFVIYGHNQYYSLQRALDEAGSGGDYLTPTDIPGGVLLACISVKKGITNLTQAIADGDARITNSNFEGEIEGFVKRQQNLVEVNDVTDLPSPVGGKITLKPYTTYQFAQNNFTINLTNELEFSLGSIIKGAYISTNSKISVIAGGNVSISDSTITYTGSATMFDIVNCGGVSRLFNLTANCPYGKLFDVNSSTPNAIMIVDNFSTETVKDLGSISDVIILFNTVQFYLFQTGLYFYDNAAIEIKSTQMYSLHDTTYLNFGGTYQGQVQIRGYGPILNTNGQYSLYFDPATTYISGVSVSSCAPQLGGSSTKDNLFASGSYNNTTVGFQFSGNTYYPDSEVKTQLYLTGNTVLTTIPVLGAWTVAQGTTYTSTDSERVTTNSSGIIEYNCFQEIGANIDANVTFEPDSGTNKTLSAKIVHMLATQEIVTFTNATDIVNKQGKSFSISEDTTVKGLTFNNTGTKMYVLGEVNNRVYEYNLTVPFDMSTGNVVYSGNSLNLATQSAGEWSGLCFNFDGTQLLTCSNQYNAIYQYDLTTPFALASATYSGHNLVVTTQDTEPRDAQYSVDGTKVFMLGITTKTVYEYNLSDHTNIGSGIIGKSEDLSTEDVSPTAMFFNYGGTKMYMLGQNTNTIYEYNLGTGRDLDTMTYSTKSKSISSEDIFGTGLFFVNNLSRCFMLGNNTDKVFQYDLSTYGDISTASYRKTLGNGNTIIFYDTAGTLPTGLSKNYVYYVINETDTTFQLSYTSGGTAVTFTTDGTGTNSYKSVHFDGSNPESVLNAGSPGEVIPQALITLSQGDKIFIVVSHTVTAPLSNIYVRKQYVRVKS